MDRWGWMILKVYIPSLGAFLVAVLAAAVLRNLGDSMFFAALAEKANWIPWGAFAVSVLMAAWASFRLIRAERGKGLLCECGGLLGGERKGRFGPYRKCLACSRNIAQRYYEHL